MSEPVLDIRQGAPPTLDHVIGNGRVVRQIRTAIDAHFNDRTLLTGRNEPPALGHILLVGPSGTGKSMFAQIIGRELGAAVHEELAQNLPTPMHLHGLLMLAEPGDCIFIDEVHELPQMGQTALYRALEERKLMLPTRSGERQTIDLPPFTLIAATTDEWTLTGPLLQRFKIVGRMEHLTEDELARSLSQRTRRLGWSIDEQAIAGIAARSRGTPRLAIRLLEATRRSARAEGASNITVQHLRDACEIEALDSLGLCALSQNYLRILAESEGPVRLNVLATRLGGLPVQTIERIIESDLIRLGLVTKDDSGRMLTAEGRRHIAQHSQ